MTRKKGIEQRRDRGETENWIIIRQNDRYGKKKTNLCADCVITNHTMPKQDEDTIVPCKPSNIEQ